MKIYSFVTVNIYAMEDETWEDNLGNLLTAPTRFDVCRAAVKAEMYAYLKQEFEDYNFDGMPDDERLEPPTEERFYELLEEGEGKYFNEEFGIWFSLVEAEV